MSEPQTEKALFDDIIASRGGEDALSGEEIRIAHALTAALAKQPSEMDAGLIERLSAMLPASQRKPRGGPSTIEVRYVGNYTAGLSDEDHKRLDELGKRIAEIDPDAEPATAGDALLLVEKLRQEIVELRGKLVQAQARVAELEAPPTTAEPRHGGHL
jgi:hypothetical protein